MAKFSHLGFNRLIKSFKILGSLDEERISGLEEIESTLRRCGAAIEKLRELQPGEMAAFRKCANFDPIESFVERKFDFQNSLKSAGDLDDSVGYLAVIPHPTKPGASRVFYSIEMDI